jgi:hypothetical protein
MTVSINGNGTLLGVTGIIPSSASTYTSAGTGAVATTVQAKLRQIVNVTDFGADPSGATACDVAFAAAVTYAKTLSTPELVINPGTYTSTSVIDFDLPNYSTITFLGRITSSVVSNPAIRIGGVSTNTFGLTVTGIKVQRSANDTSGGSSGVQLRNISASYIDVRLCTGFQDGIFCYGDQPNGGFSYNEVHMGFIHDNKRNVFLNAGGVGYCNENNFYGGTFNHSSGYPAVTTTNVEIAHFAPATLNNNRFYGPSFEDNSALATAAIINGSNNVIYWPRIENPANQTGYLIQFTVNAIECRIIGHGFTMVNSNISDLGSGNMYETREGAVLRYQTPATAGKAVLKLQGYSTSTATVLSVLDSGGVETAKITGVGEAKFTGTTRALAIYNTSGFETAYVTGAGDAFFNSISGPLTVNLTGPVTSVGNATTIVGPIPAVSLSGTISGAGNQINNVVIGTTSPLAGAFTSLSASTTLGVTGVSTLTGGAVVQGLTVGLGANAVSSNTAFGVNALSDPTLSGTNNTAIGRFALQSNTVNGNNVAVGSNSLQSNTNGDSNTAIGTSALTANSIGLYNTALGTSALFLTTGDSNIGIGQNAGSSLTTGSNNTIIGSVAGTAGLSNTVIIAAGSTERMRIDSVGAVSVPTKILVGGPTSATGAFGVQIYGDATTFAPATTIRGFSNTGADPSIFLVKTRGTTATSFDLVANDDGLGKINFLGSNGTSNSSVASIYCGVGNAATYGVTSATSIPSFIGFVTTPSGSTAGSIRMQILPDGVVNMYNAAKVLGNSGISAGGTAGNGLEFTNTTNFGIYVGSGAPTLSAAQGSMYMRSDGTTTNNRAYICLGGTSWTALITAT